MTRSPLNAGFLFGHHLSSGLLYGINSIKHFLLACAYEELFVFPADLYNGFCFL